MAAFRTITNSVATVLRNISLTYVHYVSIDYFSVSLVGILRWLTTVTAKANRSRQKKIQSRQKQINSMLYFYPAEYTTLVSSVYILLAILQFAEEFLASARLCYVRYTSTETIRKPVSTIFIRNLEMKSPRSGVRVHFYI